MLGMFHPIPIADGRMKEKIKELEKIEKLRGVTIFTPKKDKDYYYPKQLFKNVENEFKGLSFDSEKSKDILGGTDNNILDINIDEVFEGIDLDDIDLDDLDTIFEDALGQQQEIKVPPLPNQPDPSVAATTKVASVDPQTKLTQAEATLLSPGEQALAQRLNRRV